MGLENIYQTVLRLATEHSRNKAIGTHLEIGPGAGRLITLFREKFKCQSSACDYTDALIKVPGVKIDIVDLNTQGLPYPENSFDAVTATEVVEHLEGYREVLRDIYRVTKPGGVCILSTPNILNINSRLRFLWFGFWNLFGPLPFKNGDLYTTGGHINPVSSFYLSHSLIDAGFSDITVTIDKVQRSSVPKLVLLWLPLKMFAAFAWRKETNRFKTINEANASHVKTMNSLPVLLGRTIIVSARKPV